MTSHLDSETEKKIIQLFKQKQQDERATIISVTHQLSFLSEADAVYEFQKDAGLILIHDFHK